MSHDTSHLRYVDAGHVTHGSQDLGGFDVRDLSGSPFGLLDGLIIDSAEGRIVSFVVEGRGWLAPRRYMIPNAHAQVDWRTRTLLVDVLGLKLFSAFDARSVRRFSEEDLISTLSPPSVAVA